MGEIMACIGEGHFTDDALGTFGGYSVAHAPDLQDLLQYICDNGFEHHVAANLSTVGNVVSEAFETYLGWDGYQHS